MAGYTCLMFYQVFYDCLFNEIKNVIQALTLQISLQKLTRTTTGHRIVIRARLLLDFLLYNISKKVGKLAKIETYIIYYCY